MITCLFSSSQGDKAECFYVVESGEVKIMMKSKVRSPYPIFSVERFFTVNVNLFLSTSLHFPAVFSLLAQF